MNGAPLIYNTAGAAISGLRVEPAAWLASETRLRVRMPGPGNCFGFYMWNHPSVTCGDSSPLGELSATQTEGWFSAANLKNIIYYFISHINTKNPPHARL